MYLHIFLDSKLSLEELISEIRFIIKVIAKLFIILVLNWSFDLIALKLIITLCEFKVLLASQTFAVTMTFYILLLIQGFYVFGRFIITFLFMFVFWTWWRRVIDFIFLIEVYNFVLLQKLINHFQGIPCSRFFLICLTLSFENNRLFLRLLRIDCCWTVIEILIQCIWIYRYLFFILITLNIKILINLIDFGILIKLISTFIF